MTSAIKPEGSDLASRATDAALRESIEQSARDDGLATVDLNGVQTFAESFADEAFGVPALRHGVDWVVEHVEFHGASEGGSDDNRPRDRSPLSGRGGVS